MKTLPKAITGLVISSVLATAIFATPVFAKSGADHKHGVNIERIAKKLSLSEAQTISFTEIMEVQSEKRKALHDEIKAQRKALRADTMASLETILNEQQLDEIEKIMEDRKKRHHGKRN